MYNDLCKLHVCHWQATYSWWHPNLKCSSILAMQTLITIDQQNWSDFTIYHYLGWCSNEVWKLQSSWKLPNCLSTENGNPNKLCIMQSLLGLPFSPQGAGITPWWVSLTLCLGWWSRKPDQTNHSTDCVQCHAQGRVRWLLRGFVCLCSEEKLIASLWKRIQV